MQQPYRRPNADEKVCDDCHNERACWLVWERPLYAPYNRVVAEVCSGCAEKREPPTIGRHR